MNVSTCVFCCKHVKGAESFQDIRTLENGEICVSFRDARPQRGLLQDDDEWRVCVQEAALVASPLHLRKLFAVILTFCEPYCCGTCSVHT